MSKNSLYIIFTLLFVQISFAQINRQWKGYFSYNNIIDFAQSSTTLFGASDNALFSRNTKTEEINTLSTVDGLSGQTITCTYFSSKFNKRLVGYEHGLITVVNESDKSIVKVVDIINKQLPDGLKKINHFLEHNGIVYVSCDFGIVQFNLSNLFFGDTFFIGNNGAEIKVKKTVIDQGFIYAATSDGIRRADLSNKGLIDFKNWVQIATGNWFEVVSFDNQIFAINSLGIMQKYNPTSNSFSSYFQFPQTTTDMRVSDNYLLVTMANAVYIYAQQMQLLRQINSSQISDAAVNFNCATMIGNEVFIGTNEMGVYKTTPTASSAFENITPSGPLRNSVFSLKATATSLWVVYGDYNSFYDPAPLDSYGISKYSNNKWLNIPYEKVFGAKSISSIAINPNNENEVYAGSFFSGLLKIENDVPKILYNHLNSELESINFISPTYIDLRIQAGAFDLLGNLWVINNLSDNGLKVLKQNGSWQKIPTKSIFKTLDANDGQGRPIKLNVDNLVEVAIDKNSTKWIASFRNGVVAYNEKNNILKKITSEDGGNLPADHVTTVAVDNTNQLWIGTVSGLRTLSNVDSFSTENKLTTKSIIILEEGLAQELMYEQSITKIVVDGANNKWIGTLDSGIFLVSPNGQETIYHFTENNSPLPSNSINDITINSTTGEVFIATYKGLVSFKGFATGASQDLTNVFVYPNPVRPEYTGTVKISGLLNKANVKVTDIAGNLVFEATSEGGSVEWDTKAFGKYKVATGVYMVFVASQDGTESKVKKIMIIR